MVDAYVRLLGWQLHVGPDRAEPEDADGAFTVSPTVLVACTSFDAISVPYAVALDALLWLDRAADGPTVPCMLQQGVVGTFLVRAGTGKRLAELNCVEVAVGADARIAVPPTPGLRWDTPPWRGTTAGALELPDAEATLHHLLREGLRLYGTGDRRTGIKT